MAILYTSPATTFNRSTPNDGLLIGAENTRLYANDNELQSEINTLNTDLSADISTLQTQVDTYSEIQYEGGVLPGPTITASVGALFNKYVTLKTIKTAGSGTAYYLYVFLSGTAGGVATVYVTISDITAIGALGSTNSLSAWTSDGNAKACIDRGNDYIELTSDQGFILWAVQGAIKLASKPSWAI